MTHVSTNLKRTMPQRRSGSVGVISLVLLLSFLSLTLVPSGWGQTTSGENAQGTPAGAGLQAASWLLTIPYGALKVGFALVGATIGGMAYGLSGGDLKPAEAVWTTTMYGTYIITPEHLRGEKAVRFMWLPQDSARAQTGGSS